MTTTTDTAQPLVLGAGRPGPWRFVTAFLVGLAATLLLGAAVLYAFDRAFTGRVLPGVHVGAVDLSGLEPAEAKARLLETYGGFSEGEIVVTVPWASRSISYAEIGRRPDIDGMVAEALAFGRSGTPAERLFGNARTLVRGVTISPRVVYDAGALAAEVDRLARRFDRPAVNASVAVSEAGFELAVGKKGRRADRAAVVEAISAAVARLDAPARVEVEIPLIPIEPAITNNEAVNAKAVAERIARDVVVREGSDSWAIPAATIRSWMAFVATADGGYQPVLDTTGLGAALDPVARGVLREPKNASFLIGKNNAIVGVTASANGRALDVDATAARIEEALAARAMTLAAPPVPPVLVETRPALTTEEAEETAPLMERVSTWTTWFPISEKNGFGANIWIPATDIDGYVVGPGETFDFWKALGPVTRERGYRDGGAIINGRTEPQGALAGGICSTSTTLFNAALRAGFDMGSRRNHYYYIDRYPLGLDATVFKSASGSVQTMSWTNDTAYPVLIRGFRIREGNKGYVRFDLYSVPNGRTVSLSKPVVKNIRKASDSVQYTSSLKPGVRQRIEYPVDGKDVWVTRTVKDASGKVIHQETYYSHYARITGIVLVGKAAPAPPPPDTQSPPPSPAPTPTP